MVCRHIEEYGWLGETTAPPGRSQLFDGVESGDLFKFTIKKYLRYDRSAKDGDPKQESYPVRVRDDSQKPLVDPKMRKVIKGLKPGDYVRLSWPHDQVTVGNWSWPERPITKLVKLSKKEAATLSAERTPSDEAKHRER